MSGVHDTPLEHPNEKPTYQGDLGDKLYTHPDERRRAALAEIDDAKFSWFHAKACIVAGESNCLCLPMLRAPSRATQSNAATLRPTTYVLTSAGVGFFTDAYDIFGEYPVTVPVPIPSSR